jgi:hypothetical protein
MNEEILPLQNENSKGKKRLIFLTLVLTGLFLILSGSPLAGTSVSTVKGNTYPYLSLGAPLIFLGLAMIATAAIQRINLNQAIITVGLCGQLLFLFVIFIIPYLQPLPYFDFNFHTYSVVLGMIGITLSLESIIVLSRMQKNN